MSRHHPKRVLSILPGSTQAAVYAWKGGVIQRE